MNAFQSCSNTTDAVPLYLPQQLYLKPVARICINVQLPTQKMIGKSVSNWELMDQLRQLIRPDEFTHLKVIKTTAETMRFEAEVEHKNKLFRVLSKVDRKMIKLKDISDVLKIKAAEAKLDFPTKQTWDDFFSNAKDMNEMKPGERPDTVHLSNLPTKWFVPYHMAQEDDADMKPSEKIFYRIFEKFGHIRAIDIPICDPYRHRMKAHIAGLQTSTFDEAADFFEGYVQFRDYFGFTKCMDAFRHMKLMRKDSKHQGSAEEEAISINMCVDFDRSKHLTEASIKRREIVRDRLVSKEQDKEEKQKAAEEEEDEKKRALRQKELDLKSEKQKRRTQREERRKAKIMSQLKVQESDEINDKIAKEEKKLLQVQRKLEAIRIIEDLFKRITTKKESAKSSAMKNRQDNEDELTKLKRTSELEVQQQREKLNKAVKGGVVLKSILGTPRHRSKSSSSNSSVERNRNKASTSKVLPPPVDSNHIQVHPSDMMFPANAPHHWNPYGSIPRGGHNGMYYDQRMAQMIGPPVQPIQPEDAYYNPHAMHRLGRGGVLMPQMWPGGGGQGQGQYQRRPRGVYTRGRGQMGRGYNRNIPAINHCYYPQDVQDEYFRYFQKFMKNNDQHGNQQHDRKGSRSQSRSRSRSRSRSYSRRSSRSKSRTRRRRSYSRSQSRSDRRSRSRSKSKSRDRSKNRRSRSGERSTRGRYSRERRSRSRSRSRSKSPSPRRSKSPTASRRDKPDSANNGSRSLHTPEREKKDAKRRSRSRSAGSAKSVDSSAFVPPNRDRRRSTRSKSWSVPKETDSAKRRTWSKSKSPEK